jgi:hypothetical protein
MDEQLEGQRVAKTAEAMTKSTIGWDSKKDNELGQYVQSRGLSVEAIRAARGDPALVEDLYLASQYRALLAKKPEINKRANEAPKTLKPNAAGTVSSVNRTKANDAFQAHKKTGNLESAAAAILARARFKR